MLRFVKKVRIAYSPWDKNATKVRELYRRIMSDKNMAQASPKVEVSHTIREDHGPPVAEFHFNNGTLVALEPSDKIAEDILQRVAAANEDIEDAEFLK